MNLAERLIDPRSPDRRPRRAAYALPTLFTAGNVFLGFISIIQSFQGAMLAISGALGTNPHFELAAKMIGVAVLLDGLDGRIARLTNTMSDFGREMDSLADVITFGLAPAVLAFTWGAQFVDAGADPQLRDHLLRAAYFGSFLFLICGAARLARFNVQTNPVPKNPGPPDRKYFVGLPIPAAAGLIAAVVYAAESAPIRLWPATVAWIVLQVMVALLMVSTWRYRSFKDLNLLSPRSPLSFVFFACLIYLIWYYSQPVLLAMAGTYVASGVLVRLGGALRRKIKPARPPHPEGQLG
jgi:CDP-diacylglycerol--serine O-phosphatidyltransferase